MLSLKFFYKNDILLYIIFGAYAHFHIYDSGSVSSWFLAIISIISFG